VWPRWGVAPPKLMVKFCPTALALRGGETSKKGVWVMRAEPREWIGAAPVGPG
jgi:hypothetical protein